MNIAPWQSVCSKGRKASLENRGDISISIGLRARSYALSEGRKAQSRVAKFNPAPFFPGTQSKLAFFGLLGIFIGKAAKPQSKFIIIENIQAQSGQLPGQVIEKKIRNQLRR